MPMDRSRYPKDWNAIAAQIKAEANWRCQHCDRPCRKPGESREAFQLRLEDEDEEWLDELWEFETDGEDVIAISRFTRFTLTTAHLDQNPGNNDPANLRALCSVCHLAHDRPFRQQNALTKRERRGQLHLWEQPAGHGKETSRIQKSFFGGGRCLN
jgi:hypothetical protein